MFFGAKMSEKALEDKGTDEEIEVNEQKIGKLSEYLRKTRQIRMKDIYQGICSESAYIRLETGESLPEFMTLSYIFSRIGKSVNKVSMIVGYEEYEIYRMQEELERLISEGKYDETEDIFEIYKKSKMASLSPHQQYIMKMRAVILIEQGKYAEAQKCVECALAQTLPEFQMDELEAYLLGEEEWILIFMCLQCRLHLGEPAVSKQCRKIIRILKRSRMDSEMKIALYPKAVWILAESLRQENAQEKAEKAAQEALELLQENTSLFLLPQILEILTCVAVKKEDEISIAKLRQQNQALKWAYQICSRNVSSTRMNIWEVHRHSKLYLVPETVRQARKQNRLTQEMLAEKAGLDTKTLSRIENGANHPKPGTFRKLMNALNCEYDVYRTNLVTDDFSLLEIEWDISGMMMRADYAKARTLLKKMERELSPDFKENQQYIRYITTIFDVEEGKIDLKMALELCIQAFELTRPFESEEFRTVMLGVEETVIATFIANLYRKMGEEKRAIGLLEDMLAGFDNSKVDDQYHHKEITLILEELSFYCETSNEFEKALHYCQRGIELQLDCGKGGLLGSFLMQRTYIRERMGTDVNICRHEYCMVHQILELMQMEKDKCALERYYSKRYVKNIADDIYAKGY